MSKSDKPKLTSVFLNGIITENPTFRLVLGTCPTIATTTSVINAVGMGAAASFVLIGSNFVISLLRNFIPDKVRIPCFIVVICTFVTIVQLLLQAFVQSLYASLGMFIPLIVVNCIILARAEAFASKNGPLASAVDGLGMGLGFTLAISIIACVRELLGTGCIAGINLLGSGYEPMLISTMAPGGFMIFGLTLGVANIIMTPVMQTNSCGNVLLFFVSCVLSHNFIFSRFLGCCPFLGVSNKVETAAGMGLAVTFVMGLASLFTSAVYQYVLYPLQLTYLDTISFILIIAGLVQFVEMFLKKSSPALYKSLGIYLPLITTNCAVLGVATLNTSAQYDILSAVLNGVFGALGFLLAITLMAGVRERLETSHIPDQFKGFPIGLFMAGLMSVAFMGFNGLV